ncbi:MAG: exodeoxyribonuclease III [Steroidobacteraceae bacterium]|jgi:exodeoxyribonuclease-3
MTSFATWNVNSLRVRLPQLIQWLEANPVDVISIQEIKLSDPDFPYRELEALGFTAAVSGQKTYNGVATLARSPISDVVTDLPNFPDPQRRLLAATIAGVRVINVYVPNGQAVDSEKYVYKLAWLEAFAAFLEDELKSHPKALVLGDFNIAPEDRDVHDPQAWAGSVLVSPKERAAFERMTALGVSDLFRRFEQPEQSFSWWDYRQGAYRRNNGLRIDLILGSASMAARCNACRIDREPRAWERPSDHTPCTATFDI